MTAIAWFLLFGAFFALWQEFRKATNGGPNANQQSGTVIVIHLIGAVLQTAMCGRVLGWW